MTVTNRQKNTHTESRDATWIEWFTGAVSTLMVLLLIGWITLQALSQEHGPPRLSVSINHVEKEGDFYRADFSLINSGSMTAAAVRVVGSLTGLPSEEQAETTFDYAPADSRTDGSLYFKQDPRGGILTINPSGFTEP